MVESGGGGGGGGEMGNVHKFYRFFSFASGTPIKRNDIKGTRKTCCGLCDWMSAEFWAVV